jgi:hypothetical protein
VNVTPATTTYNETRFADDLDVVLKQVRDMLLEKNRNYGDSALDPMQVFSKGLGKDAGIRVRIDDKLNRILKGNAAGEDAVFDLLGYLVLLRIAALRESR